MIPVHRLPSSKSGSSIAVQKRVNNPVVSSICMRGFVVSQTIELSCFVVAYGLGTFEQYESSWAAIRAIHYS